MYCMRESRHVFYKGVLICIVSGSPNTYCMKESRYVLYEGVTYVLNNAVPIRIV